MAEEIRTLNEVSLTAWLHANATIPDDAQVVVVVVVPNEGSELGRRGSFQYHAPVKMDASLLVGAFTRAAQEVHFRLRQAAEEERMLAELAKNPVPVGEL